MAEGESIIDEWPEHARLDMDKSEPGIRLADLIGNTQSYLILSKRVKEVIESMIPKDVEYLPVEIFNHKGRLASKDYFIVNPIGAVDCLHLKKSKIIYDEPGSDEIIDIDEFVLDKKKLKNVPHLFRIKEDPGEYVMSQALALEFKKHQFTNIYSWELEQA